MENFKLNKTAKMLAFTVLAVLILSSFNISYAETPQNLVQTDIKSETDFESGSSYYINDVEGLTMLAQKVNAGDNMSGIKFILNEDLTLNRGTFDPDGNWSESGTPFEWTPIGDNLTPFSGIFDGGGHIISGLYCSSKAGFVGLFGIIVDGSVENLNIKDSYVSGMYYVGGIVGYACSLRNNSYIKNCNVNIYTSCYNNYVGAIAGCVISRTAMMFNVQNCITESNSTVAGVVLGNALVSGSNETIFAPEEEKEVNFSWLWVALIIAVSILSIVIRLLVLRKKGTEEKMAEPKMASEMKVKENPTAEMTEKARGIKPLPENNGDTSPPVALNNQSDNSKLDMVILTSEINPGALGYYYIKQTANGGYMFNLKAANHEIIATSQVYSTLAACEKGLQSIAKNASAAVIEDLTVNSEDKFSAPKFEIYTDKADDFRFRLKAANYEIIAVSQSYTTKDSCRNGIDSVMRNSETRKIINEDQETGERSENLRAEIVK